MLAASSRGAAKKIAVHGLPGACPKGRKPWVARSMELAPKGRKRIRGLDSYPFKYGNNSLNADDEDVRINS